LEYLVKAPGKLILIGEYAVLEGAPALVMAVNRYARITLSSQPGKFSVLHSPALGISNLKFTIDSSGNIQYQKAATTSVKDQLLFFSETLRFFLKRQPDLYTKSSQAITLNTADFFLKGTQYKLGLGSSAALTVALLKGFLASSNISPPPEERMQLFRWAQEIHCWVQGKSGSGIDIAASVYGGVLSFQKAAESYQIDPLHLPPDLIILPVWSGKPSSTTKMIKKVHKLKIQRPEKYWKLFRQLQRISQKAIKAVKEEDSPAFLDANRNYFNTLKELDLASGAGIITEAHQEIADLVYRQGAVYKPSGAGGGDLGLVMTCSKAIARRTAANLLHSGCQIINLKVSKRGVSAVRRKYN
jgi:phosphomevalonate kinase